MKNRLHILLQCLICLTTATSCTRGPELHLFRASQIETTPVIDLDLDIYWNYQIGLETGITYDWHQEWFYGWDATDQQIFGPIGYTKPDHFNIRRYLKHTPEEKHSTVYKEDGWSGKYYRTSYEFGFWDILVWNENTAEIQGLLIDENTSLDAVTGYTNNISSSTKSTKHVVYQPEELYAGYLTNLEINPHYDGFSRIYLEDEGIIVWYRKTDITMKPCTYIYLTQLILKHNNGKIASIDGSATLSGLARSVCLNTGISGGDCVSVDYNVRLKHNCNMNGQTVDIVGGRLLCFGMCNLNPNTIDTKSEQTRNIVKSIDKSRHYIDIQMQFNNGMDSTFVFDVTDQVRDRYKGGVLTMTIDMDTVPVPRRSSGSAFDAVVLDFEDGGTHEFSM